MNSKQRRKARRAQQRQLKPFVGECYDMPVLFGINALNQPLWARSYVNAEAKPLTFEMIQEVLNRRRL